MKSQTAHSYSEMLQAPRSLPQAPRWLTEIREQAFKRFHELGFPTKKNDEWKYINLKSILNTPFAPASPVQAAETEWLKSRLLPEAAHIIFINETLSFKKPTAITVESLTSLISNESSMIQKYLSQPLQAENPFALINTFQYKEGVFIHVPKETSVKMPIHILFASTKTQQPEASYPKVIIVIEEGANINICLDHISEEEADHFLNSATDIYLGANAHLNFIQTQRAQTDHFCSLTCQLSEGSQFNFYSVVQGKVRLCNNITVDFKGDSASADLRGLSLLFGKAQFFHHAKINHAAAHCTSHQLQKNILADAALTEFNSIAHVTKQGEKAYADQLNRSLLLSESAHVYSRPQLKIDSDEVQCSHGAATGQLVGDELFYLRSRGLDKKLANFILTYSFAQEILESIPLEALRKPLEQSIRTDLESILERVSPEQLGVV